MKAFSLRANRRCATRRVCLAVVTLAGCSLSGSFTVPVQAAPAAPQTLTFNVAARITSGQNAQKIASRVLAKGNRARIETKMGTAPVIFIASPPYLYKLIPAAKAGVRWKSDKLNNAKFNVAALFDPTAIRKQVTSRGAKALGSALLGGVRTDIFQAMNVGGRGVDLKAWLRRGDGLPLRMETRSKSFNSDVTWSNYRRNVSLPDSLFQVPAGYTVRDSQGKPGLF